MGLDVDGGAVAKVQGNDGEFAVDHVANDAEVTDTVPPQTLEGALEWFGANVWIIQCGYVTQVIHDALGYGFVPAFEGLDGLEAIFHLPSQECALLRQQVRSGGAQNEGLPRSG